MWTPDITENGSTAYQAIVDALERDVAIGRLKPGEKLPTHRALADALGLAVGTVSRAYAEAKRRGIVASGVGSGTFVRAHPLLEHRQLRDGGLAGKIDLSFNGPLLGLPHETALRRTLAKLARSKTFQGFLDYHRPWIGQADHREAGAAWIRRFGFAAEPGNVAVVCGAQHATTVTLLSIASAGDIILSEDLIDPLTKLLTGALGLVLKRIGTDADGMLPEALEEACTQQRVKALICSPDHHSPTLRVMPEARRKAIAEIARQHGIWILENAVYRPFLEKAPAPLTHHAPDISFYITSLSKIIAPGLRIGFLAAPASRVDELALGMGATNWMVPPVTAEIARDWIASGVADQLAAWQRSQLLNRNKIAAQMLSAFNYKSLPTGLHIWLHLPQPWRSATFVQEARARNVLVTPSDVFMTERTPAPHAIRISLGGAVATTDFLAKGLATLADLLGRKVDSSFLNS